MLGGKPGCGKCGFKPAEMSMNVADGKIAAFGIQTKARYTQISGPLG